MDHYIVHIYPIQVMPARHARLMGSDQDEGNRLMDIAQQAAHLRRSVYEDAERQRPYFPYSPAAAVGRSV